MTLSSWFALWHPRYRPALTGLVAAAALASALVYAENALLDLLTRALAETGSPPGAAPLVRLAAGLPVGLPLLALALFAASRLASGAVEFWKTRLNGRLTIQTKDDLETEVLLHLLRKEDAFFSRHSPAEMVNRLAVDLHRVSERRPALMRAWWSLLVLAGNLAFFAAKDWRLAVAAVAACGAGVLWTIRTTGPAAALDSSYLAQDEGVKSRFEDLLRAAPEVQVGNLHAKIRRYFTQLLGDRSRTFLEFIRLNGMLRVGNTLSYLAAFAAMLIVVLYLRSRGAGDAALALVPVIVLRLPSLFGEASELVFLRLDFQLARVSMGRLLEYETHAPAADAEAAAPAGPGAAEAIRLEQATYRYVGPAGTPQGGVSDVTAAFLPGRWTAIVGGAGSGKSTLLKLLLGRVKPQAGELRYGAAPLDALGDAGRAARLSLMPQAPVLLNASIRENLLFGRAEPRLDEADLDVVEQAGLGRVCRLKALEMLPAGEAAEIAPRIPDARRELRRRLRDKGQVEVRPFEAGHADPQHWVLECLLGGRCDRAKAAGLLTGEKARRRLRRLAQSETGAVLTALGQALLREHRALLGIPNYHVYAQLAPFPLDEPLWELRAGCASLADTASPSPRERVSLCLVCLTAAPAELLSDPRAEALLRAGSREPLAAAVQDAVAPLLGDAWQAFAAASVHPHLTWRENLLFGVVDGGSSRIGRLVDEAVLDFVEQADL
ncbi:MAG: ATP-binding cassette domain-containing protein, partial [Candidatus Methylomirabilales bacterium]